MSKMSLSAEGGSVLWRTKQSFLLGSDPITSDNWGLTPIKEKGLLRSLWSLAMTVLLGALNVSKRNGGGG